MDGEKPVDASEEKRKEGGKKKSKDGGGDGGRAELNPWPEYINTRLDMYNKLKAEHDSILAEKAAKDSKPIKVTLPDGKQVDAESWKTTPYQIACGISQGLADNTVVAKVNKVVWDLDRPLETDCTLELLKFEDEEAQAVYWHSSAHIMGEAMERVYGGCLCYGPPIENGFYYDMYLEEGGVSSNDFSSLETLCKKIIKEKQTFERLEVKKETLLEMFKYNKFKCRILNEKVNTPTTTVYRCGPLIDLCRGPHVRHTGKWPFWLSPRQVMVVPVGPTCDEYAQKVRQQFHDAKFMADTDLDPGCTLNKKIRNAQLAQYNFILVVGEKEKASGTVNIRTRDNKVHGERTVEETVRRLQQLKQTRSKQAEEEF